MHKFHFSLRTPQLFVRKLNWFSIYSLPLFSDEFYARMEDMFHAPIKDAGSGYYQQNRPGSNKPYWFTTLEGRKVRAKGSGNIGGWEWKPHTMIFNFYEDADAILFKMEYGAFATEYSCQN